MNLLLMPGWVVAVGAAGLVLCGLLVGWLLAVERSVCQRVSEVSGETVDFTRIAEMLANAARTEPPKTPSERSQPW